MSLSSFVWKRQWKNNGWWRKSLAGSHTYLTLIMLSKEIDSGQNCPNYWRETLRCMKTRVWRNVGGWRRSGWLPCMWTVGRAFLAEDHTRSGKKGGMVRVPDSPMGTTGTTATEVRKCPETGLSLDFRCGSRDVAKLEENCNLSNLKDGIVNNFSIKSTYCFFVDQKVGLVYNVG